MDATKQKAKKLGIRLTREVGSTRVTKTLEELLKELKLHAKPAASKAKATKQKKTTRRTHKTL